MEIKEDILKKSVFNFVFNSAPQDPGSSDAGMCRSNACISSNIACTLITDLELLWHNPLALEKEDSVVVVSLT